MGIEPTTSTLGRWHSTAELRPQKYRGIGYLNLELLQVMMNPFKDGFTS